MPQTRALPGVLFVLVAALTVTAFAAPQGPAPGQPAGTEPTGTGVVFGTVVDAGTSKGVADAIVTVTMRVAAPVAGRGADTLTGPTGGRANGAAAAGVVNRKVITDADGHFVFHDLPKGNVQLNTAAPGYMPANGDQARPNTPARPIALDDGERKSGILVHVWKFGVVGGTVLDEAGEPAVGMSVVMLRRTIRAGIPTFTRAATAATDDRGMYRASTLEPGDYIVAIPQSSTTIPASVTEAALQGALTGSLGGMMRDVVTSGAPPPTTTGLRVGTLILQTGAAGGGSTAALTDAGRVMTYATVAYPNAATPAQAALITIGSGEERSGIDFQLRVVPTASVSGIVTGPPGATGSLGIRLVTVATDSLSNGVEVPVAQSVTAADGAFTFLAVPAGRYRIRALKTPPPKMPANIANSPAAALVAGLLGSARPGEVPMTLAADVPVTVGAEDVSDVSVVLREGARLIGRVVFDGATAPKPQPAQIKQATIRLAGLDDTSGTQLGRINQVNLNEDGSFRTEQYPPGRYTPQLAGNAFGAWKLASVTVANRPVTDAIVLDQSDVTDAVFTYTDQVAQVSGTIRGSDRQPYPSATVVVFPADRQLWSGGGQLNTRAPRTAVAQKTGAYTITGLLGGDYLVAALEDAEAHSDGLDMTFLDALARVATRVQLGATEKKTLDLQIVRLR